MDVKLARSLFSNLIVQIISLGLEPDIEFSVNHICHVIGGANNCRIDPDFEVTAYDIVFIF